MDPRAGLDTFKVENELPSCRETNNDSSFCRPVAVVAESSRRESCSSLKARWCNRNLNPL
jgi:hypothetical protein